MSCGWGHPWVCVDSSHARAIDVKCNAQKELVESGPCQPWIISQLGEMLTRSRQRSIELRLPAVKVSWKWVFPSGNSESTPFTLRISAVENISYHVSLVSVSLSLKSSCLFLGPLKFASQTQAFKDRKKQTLEQLLCSEQSCPQGKWPSVLSNLEEVISPAAFLLLWPRALCQAVFT